MKYRSVSPEVTYRRLQLAHCDGVLRDAPSEPRERACTGATSPTVFQTGSSVTSTFEPPAPEALSIDELVDSYGPAVYRLARSVVRDDALADDVTQDTFIKVWRQLDDFRGEGSMRSWILSIAHNTAVSTLRRIRDTATEPDRLPATADPIGVSRVVEGRAALEHLRVALDELDEVSAAVVVLREVEGLSYDEIADTLGVPLPTVKTRLLRARRHLRVSLEEWRS